MPLKSSKKLYDIDWLHDTYGAAYDALPSAYQNDNCLVFWLEEGEHYLKAGPAPGQEKALGDWVATFLFREKVWVNQKDMSRITPWYEE